MRQTILFLLLTGGGIGMSGAGMTVAPGNVCDWWDADLSCKYEGNALYFDILDNSDGRYSDVWENVIVAKKISEEVNGGYMGELLYPDAVQVGETTYVIIAVDDILDFADVHSVSLPYELRFVDDDAFSQIDDSSRLISFTLPPATAYIGHSSFSGLHMLEKMRVETPFPPECMMNTFPVFVPGCRLEVPEGSLFFYHNSPGFGDDSFSSIETLPTEGMWMQATSDNSTVKCAYIGNAETILTGVESTTEENTKILDLTEHPNYEGLECDIVGCGYESLAGCGYENIKLPSTLRFICDGAFRNASITEITIPEGCKYVGYEAFAECKSLSTVYLLTTETPVFAEDTFKGIAENARLVTHVTVDRNIAPWNAFSSIEDFSEVREVSSDHQDGGILYDLRGLPVRSPLPGMIYVRDGAKVMKH